MPSKDHLLFCSTAKLRANRPAKWQARVATAAGTAAGTAAVESSFCACEVVYLSLFCLFSLSLHHILCPSLSLSFYYVVVCARTEFGISCQS
mmetsp:Transcript_69369/g.151489  ORF Transcript_69369/g.151489 Transcript_69369/m.151489 type:complete len:92 (+) Transcript_69369:177-452(+)